MAGGGPPSTTCSAGFAKVVGGRPEPVMTELGGRATNGAVILQQALSAGPAFSFRYGPVLSGLLVVARAGIGAPDDAGPWWDGGASQRHGGRRPAIHDLQCWSRQSRGWPAGACPRAGEARPVGPP